jgi:hypothetical protein
MVMRILKKCYHLNNGFSYIMNQSNMSSYFACEFWEVLVKQTCHILNNEDIKKMADEP